MTLLRRFPGSASEVIDKLFDEVAFVRDPLCYANPDDEDEETIALPGYRQTQTFSCGWIAGLMVLHCYDSRRSPSDLWERIRPHPEHGTPTRRLARGLRESGVDTTVTKHLTWERACQCISNGEPLLVSVKTRQKDTLHWVAIYGVNHRTKHVFIAGNGIPYLNLLLKSHKLTWSQFRGIWEPKGEAIICKGYDQ